MLKAQEDLKKYTDISFSFKPLKRGRSYYAIEFEIKKNDPSWNEENGSSSAIVDHPLLTSLYPSIEDWIGKKQFLQWIKLYGEEKVEESVVYLLRQIQEGTVIKNVP